MWAEATPWVRRCRERLDELGTEAAALDGCRPAGSRRPRQRSSTPLPTVRGRPVGVAARPRCDRGPTRRGRHELAALRSVRDDWPGQLAGARELLAELDAASARADALAALAASRISDVDASPVSAPLIRARGRARRARRSRRHCAVVGSSPPASSAWRHACERRPSQLSEQRVARLPGAARRGARAARSARRVPRPRPTGCNRLEDAGASQLHRLAHDALYTAPTDLVRAGELVRQYQDALRGGVPS